MRRLPLLAVLFLAAGPAAATTLTRGPYLQLLTTSSVTVVWRTDTAATCALSIRPLNGASSVIPGGTDTQCDIAVTGLVAGTDYTYAPLAGGTPLRTESIFRTDDPGRPFVFLVVGDSGSAGVHQYAVSDRMLASPADLIVHTGDMIYEKGEAAHFDPQFFLEVRSVGGERTGGRGHADTVLYQPDVRRRDALPGRRFELARG